MKIFPHITSIIVLTLLLATIGCKDKDPKPSTGECTTCQSVLEAKDYFLFKVGSWWVYEEETTHERDSMYVILANNDPNSYGFECNVKSSLTNFEYRYWPEYYGVNNNCSTTLPVTKKCLYVVREKGKFQNNLGESNAFFVRYQVGDYTYSGNAQACPNNKLIISEILDSLVLPNFTFQKTVKVDELCSSQEGNQPVTFFYTKGIGITRKEFIDSNQVWNLVNYYIAP